MKGLNRKPIRNPHNTRIPALEQSTPIMIEARKLINVLTLYQPDLNISFLNNCFSAEKPLSRLQSTHHHYVISCLNILDSIYYFHYFVFHYLFHLHHTNTTNWRETILCVSDLCREIMRGLLCSGVGSGPSCTRAGLKVSQHRSLTEPLIV